ncbi:MAG TPA: hypothetical protein VFH70_01660 [Acidimicrobiales bacterium]|nr:hypothetical protein [Acidimicrobiales bacterium]
MTDPKMPETAKEWDDHWAEEAWAWAQHAQRARQVADDKLAEGESKSAQSAGTLAAIATDKALLLTGRATSRSEHGTFEASEERLRDLIFAIGTRAGVIDAPSRPAIATDNPAAAPAALTEGVHHQ